ncbi:hypothetical protein P879_07233, partial [Paragonimus westermani]
VHTNCSASFASNGIVIRLEKGYILLVLLRVWSLRWCSAGALLSMPTCVLLFQGLQTEVLDSPSSSGMLCCACLGLFNLQRNCETNQSERWTVQASRHIRSLGSVTRETRQTPAELCTRRRSGTQPVFAVSFCRWRTIGHMAPSLPIPIYFESISTCESERPNLHFKIRRLWKLQPDLIS